MRSNRNRRSVDLLKTQTSVSFWSEGNELSSSQNSKTFFFCPQFILDMLNPEGSLHGGCAAFLIDAYVSQSHFFVPFFFLSFSFLFFFLAGFSLYLYSFFFFWGGVMMMMI